MRAQLRPSMRSSKWRKCHLSSVSQLFQKDSNMPLVDCTLNNLSEASFQVIKHRQNYLQKHYRHQECKFSTDNY